MRRSFCSTREACGHRATDARRSSQAKTAYTGRRKVEATLTSWIGAMLFAIIPLRTFLPGSPPVGSWIDYLVVLWVIVGLVTGLAIYVLAIDRWGTRRASEQNRSDEPPAHTTGPADTTADV